MQSFSWDRNFETGIKEIDEQHLYLVNLVNRYGEMATGNNFSTDEAKRALKELTDYTSRHFHEEETLMRKAGVYGAHFEEHHRSHVKFIQDLNEFAASLNASNEDFSGQLLDFLVQWLVYHILGSDQNMARQIEAIEKGAAPLQAYLDEERGHDEAVGPLLHALKSLFEQVSERNKQLILLNQSLEDKVKKRTEELSLVNEKLEKLSYTDALTGLKNRRFAMEELGAQWDLLADSPDASLVCMLIDVDRFKEVNDTCGHDAGDSVLKELAAILRREFREMDNVCRLGGDEFIVICPNLALEQGVELATRVHKKVREISLPYDNYCWEGSVSVGVAAKSDYMQDVSDLVKQADESVYAAKSAGKNCVRWIQ